MRTTTEMNVNKAPARVEMTVPGLRRLKAAERRLPDVAAPARMPRVSRLMALAIKYEGMVLHGELRDYADIARLGFITRARATQVMNLLHLAPDIQEHLLFLDKSPEATRMSERDLRAIAAEVFWNEQRKLWKAFSCRAVLGRPGSAAHGFINLQTASADERGPASRQRSPPLQTTSRKSSRSAARTSKGRRQAVRRDLRFGRSDMGHDQEPGIFTSGGAPREVR
jgi:hypothetical protein